MSLPWRPIALAVLAASIGGTLTWSRWGQPWLSGTGRRAPKAVAKKTTSKNPSKTTNQVTPATQADESINPPASSAAHTSRKSQPAIRDILFAKLDRDHDGALGFDEIPPRHLEGFRVHDANGDGNLQFGEFQAAIESAPRSSAPPDLSPSVLGTPAGPGSRVPVYVPKTKRRDLPDWFIERDADLDNQIGLYEWPAGRAERFRELDSNGDGFVTAAEARSAEKMPRGKDEKLP